MKAYKRNKAFARALSTSALNQLVSSATNFLFGVYLMRALTPEDFGLFGIALALGLFYSGAGNALLLTQMIVRTPDKPVEDRIPYARHILAAIVGGSAITFLLGATLIFALATISASAYSHAIYCQMIVAVGTSMLVKDFFVRHAYNQRKENWALNINLILAAALVTLIALVSHLTPEMTVEITLAIYATCQAAAAAYGYHLSELRLQEAKLSNVSNTVREAWRGGSYSLLAHFIVTIRTQAHTIILAATTGPAGVAVVNAARIFVTPVAVLLPALSQVFLPRLAEARIAMADGGKSASARYSWLIVLVVAGYSVILLGFYKYFHAAVVGEKYDQLYLVVAVWCVYTMLSAYRSGIEIFWMAQKLFKAQALLNFVGAIVSLSAVYLVSRSHGYYGAVLGLVVAELIVLMAMVVQQRRLGIRSSRNWK